MKILVQAAMAFFTFGLVSIPANAQPDIIFTDVNIVDVASGTVIEGQTVAVEDGVIVYVGEDEITGDESTRIIIANGHYLIPGMWDAHVHSLSNVSWHFPLFLFHGVTSVRNMHTTEPNGLALIRELREELEVGQRTGPRFIANGFIVSGESTYWPQAIIVSNAAESRSVVDELIAEQMDFIKVYDELDGESYRALLEHAEQRGIAVDGHLPYDTEPLEAISLGQRTIEHSIEMTVGCADPVAVRPEPTGDDALPPPLAAVDMLERYDAARKPALCQEIAEAMAVHGTSPVPTIVNNYSFSHASVLASEPQFS